MNAALKVGSGSDRPESRSWPICLAMTALGPRKPLISKEMSGFSAFIRCFWLCVFLGIYHVSTISPEYVAAEENNEIFCDLTFAQILERMKE